MTSVVTHPAARGDSASRLREDRLLGSRGLSRDGGVWAELLVTLDARGPMLRRTAGRALTHLSRAELNAHFAILCDVGLVQLRGGSNYTTADGWRKQICVIGCPEGVDAETWAELQNMVGEPGTSPC